MPSIHHYKNIDRIVRLWRAGYTMKQIGKKLKITKQCVSARLQIYFEYKRPVEMHIWKRISACKVCGIEREEIYKSMPVYKMKAIKLGETITHIKQHHWICDDCTRENLIRCGTCGAIGRLGIDFLPSYCYNIWVGKCKQCNREATLLYYYKKNLT